MSLAIGDIHDITIEKIVYGGDGLGRVEGQAVFVPYAAPGDHLRVRITSLERNFARGVIEAIVEPSSARRAAPCQHFGVCGGCQLQHLQYAAQLESKAGFIRESLRRVGGIDWQAEIPVLAASEFGYRARAEIKINGEQIGFYQANSHDICEVTECPILLPAANAELQELHKPPNLLPSRATRVYLTVGDDKTLATPATGENARAAEIDAKGTVVQTISGFRYNFGVRTFFQSNRLLVEQLVGAALGEAEGKVAFDLYAGAGLFSLPLAQRFQRVFAVEGSGISVRHGLANVQNNHIHNVTYECLSVEAWLKHKAPKLPRPDFALLDPPRAGAGAAVIIGWLRSSPKREFHYVSCDPTTLGARFEITDQNEYKLDVDHGAGYVSANVSRRNCCQINVHGGINNFAIRHRNSAFTYMPRRLAFAQLSVREQPLVFLAVAFILGELVAARSQFSNLKSWLVSAIILFAIAIVFLCLQRFQWQRDWIITAMLLLSCFACGACLWSLNEAGVAEHRIKKLFANDVIEAAEPVEIWGTVTAAPELAPDRIYLEIAIERIATRGKELLASGTVRLVVPFAEAQDRLDYDALQLDYGVRIRALTNLRKAQGYRNPGAPNFAELLEYHGYDATGLIKSALLIERLGEGSGTRLLSLLYSIRANAIAVILQSLTQPTSGILAAALFGNQHFLARDVAESFRLGGTFHLLVISGLHVAVLALVILWLTTKLIKSRGLRLAVIMLLLWAYTLMVGAQSAIMRATVMLTFVLIGQLIFRTAPGANTLAASALVLLAWQPHDLFNPGFQLSYLTVLMVVAVMVPLLDRLKQLGEWQPSALTPYPPRVPAWLKWYAEVLHWNEAEFRAEMHKAPIHYRLEKARMAKWLSATRVRRGCQQSLRWTATTIIATVGIQLGLLPVMIAYFHRVSFVSPLTNVIQGALMFVLMIAGAVYLLFYSLVGSVVMKFAAVMNWLGWLTAHAADWLLVWRKLNFRVPDYGANSAWMYAVYFALVLVFIVALTLWNPFSLHSRGTEDSQRMRRGFIFGVLSFSGLALLALITLLIWHPHQHEFEPGRLSITFLDVGQGDGMLISFPNGKLMLLDSGGRMPTDLAQTEGEKIFIEDRISIGEAAVSPYLWQRGIKRLDFIAASHGHSDHTQGFADIGKSFVIGEALTGVIPTDDKQFDALREAANYAGAPLRSIARGDRLEIEGVQVEVLTPFREALNAVQAANNQSLTLRLRFGQRVFLLTGDIEKEIERRLVAENEDLKTSVLKVAHHGSRSSSTAAFLARAQPTVAVISVADPSPYDHPHPETMTGLQKIGARVLPTSRCGAITISTDGNDLQVKTFVKCE